jgi:uncharacterized protein (DUF58 family)
MTSSSNNSTFGRYADPAVLMRIRSLELRVKAVMEGFFNGLHRSPFHGFSVEFSAYRQYTDGDDPRYLDWKVAARSDRYYIKLFEDETNLRCNLLVDNSRSMSFGSLDYTKADYAKTLAACLAWALTQQRDAAGLIVFDEDVEDIIPARFRHGQLRQILMALDKAEQGASTDLTKPLERVAGQVRKRGLVVLISDLLAPVDGLERNLGYLAAAGHELVVFQILDPQELNFEFDAPALFQDMESGQEIYVDPSTARKQYQERLQKHLTHVQMTCEKLGAIYELCSTDCPLEIALSEFMLRRQKMKAGSARIPQRRSPAGRST